jgi:HSP20 family protein
MVRSFWDRNFRDPFAGWDNPLTDFRSAMDRLLEDFSRGLPLLGWGSDLSTAYPPVNLSEDADRFLIETELPGVTLSDLEVVCQGQTLTLRGERKESTEPEGAYERRERPTGAFVRTMTLPADVDADKIEATFEDGVLLVTVPKAAEAKARKIEVKKAGELRLIEAQETKKKEA